MDFASTSLLNMSQEKSKFINILHKIKNLLLIGKKHKLINTATDKLIVTDSPKIIYENINFSHPVLNILQEYINKLQKTGKGDVYFINLSLQLVDAVSNLLDNGIKPKFISDCLMDLSTLFTSNIKDNYSSNSNVTNSYNNSSNSSSSNNFKFTNNKISYDDKKLSVDIHKLNLNISFVLPDEIKNYIKIIIDEATISNLLIEAIEKTKSFDLEKIRIFKIQTGSFEDSNLIRGIILDTVPLGTVKQASNTSIGLFNCPLDITRTELKGNLLMKTSEELLNFSKDEMKLMKNTVDSLNVNVAIFLGNVNDLFLEFLSLRNILVLKIFNKFDLKRLRVFGEISDNLGSVKNKGFIEKVEVHNKGGKSFTSLISKSDDIFTIILRNSILELINEKERLIELILENLNSRKELFLCDLNNSKMIEIISLSNISSVVKSSVINALKLVENILMLEQDKVRATRYSFEFIAKILEIDDYLFAKPDKLDIKPRDNPNWDQD